MLQAGCLLVGLGILGLLISLFGGLQSAIGFVNRLVSGIPVVGGSLTGLVTSLAQSSTAIGLIIVGCFFIYLGSRKPR